MKTALSSQPEAGGADVKTNLRPRSGFTMVELLTVITIIMILAALVLGGASFAGRKADEGRCQARLQTIKNALEEFKLDYGKYPQGIESTTTHILRDNLFYNPLTSGRPNGEKRPYISDTNFLNSSSQFVDPWGTFIHYQTGSGAHNKYSYDLWSLGPNATDDSLNPTTSDDINNWSSGH